MADLARYARRFRNLRLLRASLALGAAYDAAFAVLMVAAPGWLARGLRLPLPPRFYLWLLAVLLLMLAALYLLAARDPRRYSGIVRVTIAGRLAGAAALGLAAAREPAWSALWGSAAADALLGIAPAVFWHPSRR